MKIVDLQAASEKLGVSAVGQATESFLSVYNRRNRLSEHRAQLIELSVAGKLEEGRPCCEAVATSTILFSPLLFFSSILKTANRNALRLVRAENKPRDESEEQNIDGDRFGTNAALGERYFKQSRN